MPIVCCHLFCSDERLLTQYLLLNLNAVAADPVGMSLVLPECCEDMEVIPQRSYFGGVEGEGDFTWFRLQSKLQGFDLPSDAKLLGNSQCVMFHPTVFLNYGKHLKLLPQT